jgi:3-oxoacyl-[acyl-carrier protein] reductase
MPEPAGAFAGRVAVVTGASHGIGAGIAAALAREGAKVVVSGRDPAAMARVVADIRGAGGVAEAIAADVTDAGALVALRAQTERLFGPASLLVANAGGGGAPEPLVGMSAERWRATLDANLTSAFLTLQVFLPPMVEAKRGAVVTMASTAGRQLSGASAAYAAAKSGLLSLTRQAAAEVAPFGVRVNALAPSSIVTDRLAAQPQAVRQQIAQGFPLRRLGEVEDVAAAALFLLGDGAGWITGVTLDVAGGRVML